MAYCLHYILYIVALLESGSKNRHIPLILGILFGLLIGTKYSGLLYAGIIVIVYFRKIRPFFISISSFPQFAIPLFLLGVSWYVRNYVFTNNFVYPFGTVFSPTNTTSLSLLLTDRYGAWKIIQSIFSEFSLVGFIPFVVPLYIFNKNISPFVRRLFILGLFNIFFFLFLPSSSGGVTSSMRYVSAGMIPLIIGFLLTMKTGEIFALCSVIATLPQLSYHPKLGLLALVLVFSFYRKR